MVKICYDVEKNGLWLLIIPYNVGTSGLHELMIFLLT